MKLVIVTVVDEYQNDIFKIFKEANIEAYSEVDIEGYKTTKSLQVASNWFASERSSSDSEMFFSFIEDKKIDKLFNLLKEFNNTLETNTPVHAVIVPIERYI